VSYNMATRTLVPKPSPRRRFLWRVVGPLVVAVAAAGCVGGGAPGGDAGYLLQRVNEIRAASGLPPLAWCGTLANAAAAHSQDMASHGFMSHTGSDGSSFATRAGRHGYVRWTRLTENIALGPASVDAALATWMGSGGHAAHILDPGVHHAGFARAGNAWTQMFGANGTC
jgi:uncharacterized protein YkwD